MNLKDCIERGYLKKLNPDKELSEKELNEARYDLFHAAKSVLFSLGYVEKRHISVLIVLEELNKEGKLEAKYTTNFKAAMSAREDADYHYSHSKETAEYELSIAKEFLDEMTRLLNK